MKKMKFSKLFTLLFLIFSFSINAQIKINENKYNKLIRAEKYTEALDYLNEKGGVNTQSYWFNDDVEQLSTFCFDPNFDDHKYTIIINYVNNCFKDLDYKNRSYYQVAECYFVKANHYLWKGDYEKANLAYKESLEKLEKYKKENDINPEDIKAIKSVIDRLYFNQTETHKLEKALRGLDVSTINLSEEQAYEARQKIKNLLAEYDMPHKVHLITYENSSTLNDNLASPNFRVAGYFEDNFFYNMPKIIKDKYLPTINLYNLFDDKYKTKEQKDQQTGERKTSLIKKYGKNFGEAIFNGKIQIGMTKKMLEDEFNKPRSVDVFEYSEFWTWSDVMVTIDKKTQKVTGITELN
jgi:tetratricopeptide (TPR) repeat protein